MAITTTHQDLFAIQLYPPDVEQLASNQLLIPIEDMVEVLTLTRRAVCPVPGVAPGILGVTNQRGQLIWVVDLRGMVASPALATRPNPEEKLKVVVLAQGDTERLGLVVHQLRGITTVDLATTAPVLDQWQHFYPHCDRQFAQGTETALSLNLTSLFGALQAPARP